MRRQRKKRLVVENRQCYFCQNKVEPSYKDYPLLAKFINLRGGIVPRRRSGNCSKHQRRLAGEIKKARHLALLPFTGQPKK